MLSNCTVTAQAKCVIAGEHAVLRGHPALVCPLSTLMLSLNYHYTASPLHIILAPEQMHWKSLFYAGLTKSLQLINKSITTLTGTFKVDSNIPIGVNLGASAALCVALSKWIAAQGWLDATPVQLATFATQLEHVFHGESSGMDVAAVLSSQPILFKRDVTPWQTVTLCWQPQWYVSSCQHHGLTADCVKQVKQLLADDPTRAQTIDNQMHNSVMQAFTALQSPATTGFALLCDAMQQAAGCFEQWGLVSQPLATHIKWLYQQGASAVKPTGAGSGGYALSLWENPPPLAIRHSLLPVLDTVTL